VAMFMVGGGILTHGLPFAHDLIHHAAEAAGPLLGAIVPSLLDVVTGVIAGAVALVGVGIAGKITGLFKKPG